VTDTPSSPTRRLADDPDDLADPFVDDGVTDLLTLERPNLRPH